MKKKGILRMTAVFLLAAIVMLAAAGCAQVKEISLNDCAAALLAAVPQPVFGPVGGDWAALGLARWGGEVSEAWFDSYYTAVEKHVIACDGVLSDRKYTEYSRLILALTAIGKDPTDVGGHNLLIPLADYEQTLFQGLNGPVFALLALDSGNYEIPENIADSTQATRELYVDYIVNARLPEGGWSLAGGTAEVDLTAMALQALAKYRDRADVTEAVEKGLAFLSSQQNENGGFTAYEAESSESIAQTIVALTELGVSLDDPRFVKQGKTLLDALARFLQEDGTFAHLLDGKSNLLATEQAFYALVAADRLAKGESSLYRMR